MNAPSYSDQEGSFQQRNLLAHCTSQSTGQTDTIDWLSRGGIFRRSNRSPLHDSCPKAVGQDFAPALRIRAHQNEPTQSSTAIDGARVAALIVTRRTCRAERLSILRAHVCIADSQQLTVVCAPVQADYGVRAACRLPATKRHFVECCVRASAARPSHRTARTIDRLIFFLCWCLFL